LSSDGPGIPIEQPLPPRIRAVIETATQSDARWRYRSAGELAHAFNEALRPASPATPTPVPRAGQLYGQGPAQDAETQKRKPWGGRTAALAIGLGALALIVLVGYLALGLGKSEEPDAIVAPTSTATASASPTPSPTATDTGTPEPSATSTQTPTPTPTSPPTTHPTATPSATPPPAPPTATPPPPIIVIGSERLNVYAAPGERYELLGELQRGDQLQLLGRSPDDAWWQVDYLSWLGWIRAQPVGVDLQLERVPVVTPPPLPTVPPTAIPSPTRGVTPSATPGSGSVGLQNPGFEGISNSVIPGWNWWAEDNFDKSQGDYDPGTSFDTPAFKQADDSARFISGPTLQIDATGHVRFRVHVFQTVGATPDTRVNFQASAGAYTDSEAIKVAAGIDPNGGPDCRNALWADVEEINQTYGVVRLVAPSVTVGGAGEVTVCLYAEPLYAAVSNAVFFDDATIAVTP
jgi:hypothetical protein